ncbi:MAG: hypothetical protein AB7P99_14260 [Vicinamibacterales bacterium]
MFGKSRREFVEALRDALTHVPEGEGLCPFFRAPCIKHRCVQYIEIHGKHPQTGAPVHEWDCSIKWLPYMQIETSQQVRQAGAATESFRNEMVGAANRHNLLVAAHVRAAQLARQGDASGELPLAGSLIEH